MISFIPFARRLGLANATRILFLGALGFTTISFGQPASPNIPLPPSTAPTKPKQPDPVVVEPAKPAATEPTAATTPKVGPTTEFDPKPLSVKEVGLAMLLPKGSKANVEHAADANGGYAMIEISPPDSTWIMYVRSMRLTDPLITTEEVMSEIVRNIESAANNAKVVPETLDKNKALIVSGRPSYLLYVHIPKPDGKAGLVRGIALTKIQAATFMRFEMVCDKSEFERARRVFEDTTATALIEDPRAEAERIKVLVKTGVAFINSITEEDFKCIAAAFPEQWERSFRLGKTGGDSDSKELSYSRYRYSFGERSTFPGIPKDSKSSQQLGIFVQIDSRAVDGKIVIDSQGQFYLSADRKEEFWSLVTARKDRTAAGIKDQVYTETGVRNELDMSVSRAFPDGRTDATKPQIAGEGYLSRVEALLMPQLLVRKKMTADFAFFTYQHDSRNIRLRRDSIVTLGTAGRVFEIRSRLNEDCLWQASRYRENGEFIMVDNPDGTLREPTTIEKLRTLWKSKGLPLD